MPIWNLVAGPVLAMINKIIPDKTAAAAAQVELQKMAASGALQEELKQLEAVTTAQSDINKVEAASTSVFVAGWRPFVGWVCGFGLAMEVIIAPLGTWLSTLAGHPVTFPVLNNPLLESTLAGMLGLGFGLRTWEKAQGVAGNH
jgi:hypothetical protein